MRPDSLGPEQKTIYDAIVSGPRSKGSQHFPLTDEWGVLQGPFNAFLLSPRIGLRVQELGAALRYQTELAQNVATLKAAGMEPNLAALEAVSAPLGDLTAGQTRPLLETELAALNRVKSPES